MLLLKNADIFSDQINEILQTTLQRIYAGFDPTADSLHVGNLLIIMGLLRFQRAGHHPIALVGGATGKIGDPSGRSTDRPQLSADAISHNIHCIQKQLKKIFKNHEKYFWNDKSQGKLNPVRCKKIIVKNKNYDYPYLCSFSLDSPIMLNGMKI